MTNKIKTITIKQIFVTLLLSISLFEAITQTIEVDTLHVENRKNDEWKKTLEN